MRDFAILKELENNSGIELQQVDNLYDANGQYLYGKACTLEQDKVTGLVLINKKLKSVPPEVFRLTSLRILVIIGNQLLQVPDAFGNLTQLQILDLSHNRLTCLPESIGNLINLKRLFLSTNQLNSLPDSLGNLVNLEKLNLSTNKFRNLPDCIEKMVQLQNLNIKSNKLENLPSSLGNLIYLKKLNAGYNQLDSLPEFTAKLVHLENLNLSYNCLTCLPEHMEKLAQLERLNLSNNQLASLPRKLDYLGSLKLLNIDSNRLKCLDESITDLNSLQWLFINFNQIKEMPEFIGQLSGLKALFLNANQLERLPESIGELTGLQTLMAGSNDLKSLPESLGKLSDLQTLDVNSNLLSSLPESTGDLSSLQAMDLRNNKLTSVQSWILNLDLPLVWNDFFSDHEINLYNNPLLSPPVEIIKQGNTAVRNYFEQMASQGQDTIYEAKIMIVGEPGAGKTTLMNKLFDRDFKVPDTEQKSTTGIDVRPDWEFKLNESIDFKALIWDFGGQQIQYTLHQFFLTTDCLYILMAEKRKEILHLDYWLNIINVLGKDSPVIVLFNEINLDSVSSFVFDEKKYKELFPGLDITRLDINLANIEDGRFDLLVHTVKEKLRHLELTGRTVPANWIKIRKELVSRKARKTLTINEYFKICGQYGICKEPDQLLLLKYFHLLGIVLHFTNDPNLCDTLFLDPNWTVDAVYTVLSDREMEKNNGIFNKDFIDKLWSNKGYKFEERTKLLQLMLKNNFELCYNLPGKQNKYIVPLLLPHGKPEYSWDDKGNMLFRFQYPFMPKGIVNRLIVRLHEYIDNQLVWNQGVVLRRRGIKAQIMERFTVKEGLKIIEIRLTGIPLLCKEFLTVIREEINRIQKSSFPDLPYDEMVPCNCPKCRTSPEPNFFYYKVLEDFLVNNDMEIQCMISRKMIKITDLIQAVFTDKEVVQMNETLITALNKILNQNTRSPLEKFFTEYDFNESQKQIIYDIVNTNLINKQIADKLDIEENAFAQRLKKIYRKCGVQSKAELIRKIYTN